MWNLLYEERVMRPPHAADREKKIWVAASFHTWQRRRRRRRAAGKEQERTLQNSRYVWIKGAAVGYLGIIQFLPLWCDEVEDAVEGSGERHSSDEQDDQHHVGKCGREIHHLSTEGAGPSYLQSAKSNRSYLKIPSTERQDESKWDRRGTLEKHVLSKDDTKKQPGNQRN